MKTFDYDQEDRNKACSDGETWVWKARKSILVAFREFFPANQHFNPGIKLDGVPEKISKSVDQLIEPLRDKLMPLIVENFGFDHQFNPKKVAVFGNFGL